MMLRPTKTGSYRAGKMKYHVFRGNYSYNIDEQNGNNYSLQDLSGCLTVKVKFSVKNAEIARIFSGLA